MTTFFTSDTHFGHANIIGFCGRPFTCVEDMDEQLISLWNAVVAPQDTVWHLGDFMFGPNKRERAEQTLARLHGTKHLVTGNHDDSAIKKAKGWAGVDTQRLVPLPNGLEVMLRHKYEPAPENNYLLHGHAHGSLPVVPGRMDVGVDCWGYKPISEQEVIDEMARGYIPVAKCMHLRTALLDSSGTAVCFDCGALLPDGDPDIETKAKG